MRRISAAWSRSLAAACLLLWAWVSLVPTGASAATPPALSVVGNQLVAGGMPLQLRGVNRGAYTSCSYNAVYDATRPADLDDDFADGPVDLASTQAMTSWGINAVRLPVNEGCWLGDPTQSDAANANQAPLPNRAEAYPPYLTETAAAYRQDVGNYVNLLSQQGLYVIIALQYTAPRGYDSYSQDYFPDATETPAFWASAAAAFGGDANVLFDPISEIAASPYNGPYYAAGTYGYTSTDAGHNWSLNDIWNCWLNGCANVPSVYGPTHSTAGIQSLITTIRATGANNPIMVSSPDFAFGYGETGCTGSGANCWQDYTPADPDHRLVVDAHLYDYVVDGAIPTDSSGHADPSSTAERLRLADAMLALSQTVVPIAQRFPVVLGELGETDCDNADGSAIFMQGMLGDLDALSAAGDSVGVLPWTWDSENDGSEVLGSGWQCPTGQYGNGGPLLIENYSGQPTAMGRVYATWLASKAQAATAPVSVTTTTGATPAPVTTTSAAVPAPLSDASPPAPVTATTTTSGTSTTHTATLAADPALTLSGSELRCAGIAAGAQYTFADAASGRTVAGPQSSDAVRLSRVYEETVICSATLDGQSVQSAPLPVPGPVSGSSAGRGRMVAVCPAGTTHGCRVTLSLRAGASPLGTSVTTLRGGAFRTVTVTLDAAGRRRLARAHRLSATLTGTERVGGHTATIARRTWTLRAPLRRR